MPLLEKLNRQVRGDALALFAQAGADLRQADWQQLDNVIYDELAEYFGQGTKPSEEDVQRLVDGYKAGGCLHDCVCLCIPALVCMCGCARACGCSNVTCSSAPASLSARTQLLWPRCRWCGTGRYNYGRHHEGEEGEDVNKDDAGEDLGDALREQ